MLKKKKKWTWIDGAACAWSSIKWDGTIIQQYVNSACEPFPGCRITISQCPITPSEYNIHVVYNTKSQPKHTYDGRMFLGCPSHRIDAKSLASAKRKAPSAIRKALIHIMQQHQSDYQNILDNLNL